MPDKVAKSKKVSKPSAKKVKTVPSAAQATKAKRASAVKATKAKRTSAVKATKAKRTSSAKATKAKALAKPVATKARSKAAGSSGDHDLEAVVLETADLHLPMGKLIDEVRKVLVEKKRPAASPDDLRRVIEQLLTARKLHRAGRLIFPIVTAEDDEDDDFRPAPKAKKPKKGSRCIFPLPHGKTDFVALTKAVAKKFEVVEKSKEALVFRSPYEPMESGPFTLTLEVGPALDRLLKRSTGAYAVLSFADLDEVLFEANGLIEAQATIYRITKLPFFNEWNGAHVTL